MPNHSDQCDAALAQYTIGQPYTAELLPKLPAMGVKKLVVISPAFSADCLETLEELDVEGKNDFIKHGGESFVRVPCLNTDPAWVAVVKGWIDGIILGETKMLTQRFETLAE